MKKSFDIQIQESLKLAKEGKFQEAFSMMDKIFANHFDELDNCNKNTFILYNNYLIVCAKVKEHKKGLALFESIKKIAWKNNAIFHSVSLLFVAIGDFDNALKQIKNCYLYDNSTYWKTHASKDPDLNVLANQEDFRKLAKAPYSRNYNGAKLKDLIISSVEQTECPRRHEICVLSGQKIGKGDKVLKIEWLFGGTCYALQGYLEKSELYDNYKNKFLENKYDIKEFDINGVVYHPKFKALIRDFDLDKALHLIFYDPPIKQTPFWHHSGGQSPGVEFAMNLQKMPNTIEHWGYQEVVFMISILFKIGHKADILKRMIDFPKHAVLLLAMANDLRFQEKAAAILDLPKLPDIFDLFREKKKFSLEDMLEIIKFGKENPVFLELLGKCLNQYQTHYLNFFRLNSEFSKFEGKNPQLCYFFISKPDKHLFLYNLLTKKEFPVDQNSSLTYMKAFYFRSAIFYVLFQYPERVDSWLDYMQQEVRYFPSGSPQGYINDTKRMVNKFLKKF